MGPGDDPRGGGGAEFMVKDNMAFADFPAESETLTLTGKVPETEGLHLRFDRFGDGEASEGPCRRA